MFACQCITDKGNGVSASRGILPHQELPQRGSVVARGSSGVVQGAGRREQLLANLLPQHRGASRARQDGRSGAMKNKNERQAGVALSYVWKTRLVPLCIDLSQCILWHTEGTYCE